MAVPSLVLYEVPMGILGFQKEAPFQNLIPFPVLPKPFFPKWCSWMRRILGGAGREANQSFIAFCFGELVPKPLVLRDAGVRVLSSISLLTLGGW
jgi:hypothetical protein